MFTGIIEEVGTVREAGEGPLTIAACTVLEGTKAGDSIAVNGACLTVVTLNGGSFTVNLVPETLAKTNLGQLRSGDQVNLERALSFTSRIGGHLVQGHVEGRGTITRVTSQDDALWMEIQAPSELDRYIVRKGFVAVDGVSLTVVDCKATVFSVTIIPFTQKHTTLGRKTAGEDVNLETDVVARYIEKLMGRGGSGITWEFLAEHGFVDPGRPESAGGVHAAG